MPDYRGTGGTLQGLGEFLQSLANANDPDKQKREALERELATDPDLAYKLQQNPQQLQGLVGNKPLFGKNKAQELIDSVSSTPLTAKQSALKAVQDYQNQNANNAAKSGVDATNSLSAGVGVGVGNIPQTQITPPTTQQQDIYNRVNGLPTAQEQKIQDLTQQNLEQEVAARTKKTAEDDNIRRLETVTRTYLAQHKLDPYTAFKTITTLPPEVQQGLTSAPSLQEAVKDGMAAEQYKRMYELEQLRSSSRFNQDLLLKAASVEGAKRLAENLGVPVESVYQIQQTPGAQSKYSDPSYKPQPGEEGLVEVARRMTDFSNRYSDKQLQIINQSYSKMKQKVGDDIASGKEKNPQAAINTLNSNAASMFGGFGIAPPIAEFDPHRFNPLQKAELTFSDPGDPRLGYGGRVTTPIVNANSNGNSAKGNPAPDPRTFTLQDYQNMINNGGDYIKTRNDPRIPAAIRQKLKPAQKN